MALFRSRYDRDLELAEEWERAKFHEARVNAEHARIEKRRNEYAREIREWIQMNPNKPMSEFPAEITKKYGDLS